MLQLVIVTAHIFWNFENFEEKLLNLNEMSIYNCIILELK